MSLATPQEAKDYAGDQSISDSKAQYLLDDAADWIASIVTAPDPETGNYQSKAKRAELRVYEYLASGAVLTSSTSVGNLSVSYSNSAKDTITEIVEKTMSAYVAEEPPNEGVGFIGTFPIRRG